MGFIYSKLARQKYAQTTDSDRAQTAEYPHDENGNSEENTALLNKNSNGIEITAKEKLLYQFASHIIDELQQNKLKPVHIIDLPIKLIRPVNSHAKFTGVPVRTYLLFKQNVNNPKVCSVQYTLNFIIEGVASNVIMEPLPVPINMTHIPFKPDNNDAPPVLLDLPYRNSRNDHYFNPCHCIAQIEIKLFLQEIYNVLSKLHMDTYKERFTLDTSNNIYDVSKLLFGGISNVDLETGNYCLSCGGRTKNKISCYFCSLSPKLFEITEPYCNYDTVYTGHIETPLDDVYDGHCSSCGKKTKNKTTCHFCSPSVSGSWSTSNTCPYASASEACSRVGSLPKIEEGDESLNESKKLTKLHSRPESELSPAPVQNTFPPFTLYDASNTSCFGANYEESYKQLAFTSLQSSNLSNTAIEIDSDMETETVQDTNDVIHGPEVKEKSVAFSMTL